MAPVLIIDGVMVLCHPDHPTARLETPGEDENGDERDRDPEDTPETPLDEPAPPRIEDPPPQPNEKGPYVVSAW
jgi:hypothetical protein